MKFSPPRPTPTQGKYLRGYAQSINLRLEGQEELFFPASYMSAETATINTHNFLHH